MSISHSSVALAKLLARSAQLDEKAAFDFSGGLLMIHEKDQKAAFDFSNGLLLVSLVLAFDFTVPAF